MKAAWLAGSIAAALVAQTALAFRAPILSALDLVLVVVVYAALSMGPMAGVVAGTVAGLAQDALSGGIVGIGGFANSVVGYLAGLCSAQFIVAGPATRFVVFVLATLAHAALFVGFYAALDLGRTPTASAPLAVQCLGNAFVGVFVFQAIERMPGAFERWRSNRRYRSRSRL